MLIHIKKLIQSNYFWLIAGLLFIIPACLPLLRSDFFHFSDEPSISLIYEMSRIVKTLQLPPRWIPDVSYNYGYPLFNFYYPLPFIIGSLIYFISSSLTLSIKLYFLMTVVLSFVGMFLLLRKHTTLFNSFVGGLIYIYSPYRAVDLYVRGAIGELTAFTAVPFVCLFIYKLFEKQSLKNSGLLALFVALFILSHNLALMLFFPWFVGYALYLYLKAKNRKFLVAVISSFILGISISAYWLLPAFGEKNLLVSSTPFNYKDHFPFIKQLIYSPFKYGSSQPGPYDDLTFQIGFANMLLIVGAGIAFIKSKTLSSKLLAGFTLSAFVVALFLMNIRSTFLWEKFSLANYFQFPWRILMFTTFLTSFCVIFIKNKYIAFVILVVALINTVNYFRPSEYYSPTDNYFFNRFFANRDSNGISAKLSSDYKNYSEDYLLLPVWVKTRPTTLPSAKITTHAEILVTIKNILEISPVHYSAQVNNTVDPSTADLPVDYNLLTINNYYFPGWSVFIDGVKQETEILEPHGNIGVRVTEGKHTLEVKWRETPFRLVADGISLAGLAVSLVLVVKKDKGQKHG